MTQKNPFVVVGYNGPEFFCDRVRETQKIIGAIENDRKPYVDAVAGKNALEMVLAIYKSQKTGQPVKLPLKDFASTDMKGEF